MSGRPLAVGAGAGSLSSLLVALLGQHLQQAPVSYGPPGIIEGASRFEPPLELPPIFWIGLLAGVLIGILISSLLDLLYLFKQYLAIELRNRLATLSLKGSSRV